MGVHARCNRRLRSERHAVANGAMLLVKVGAGQVVGFARLDRNRLRHIFRDARVQYLMREETLEGHIGVGGGNRRAAAAEIEVTRQGKEDKPEQEAANEFDWRSFKYLFFTLLPF